MPSPTPDLALTVHTLFAASDTVLTTWGAVRFHDLARLSVLPQCIDGEGQLAVIHAASASEAPRTDFVDVVIDMQDVPGTDGQRMIPVVIRVVPELRFVTTEGPVRADEVEGKNIARVRDGVTDNFVVPSVLPISLPVAEAVSTYGVAIEGATVCVGRDSTVAAIVFVNP